MGIFRKVAETWRFWRYGPTRVEALAARVDALVASLRPAAEAMAQRWAAQDQANQALQDLVLQAGEQIQRLRIEIAEAERRIAASGAARAEETRRDADALRTQITGLAAAIDRAAGTKADRTQAVSLSPGSAAIEEGFYPVLEAHFRGSEGDVGQRLSFYREHVEAMPAGRIADLGCGRGEWLGLLAEWGREGVGVDSNAVVIAELRAKGIHVEEADALGWLQGQPDASLAGVTAFHLVEHMPFGTVLRLAMEAHRVLVPGGALIIETPNPENVGVATHSFWLDPTHLRPLPAELLEVALRYCGFGKPVVVKLHPPSDGSGPGRDYAVIAGKAAAQ